MILVIYSEKKHNRIVKAIKHYSSFIPIISPDVEINYRLIRPNGIENKVLLDPKNYVWIMGLGPVPALPFDNMEYLHKLNKKLNMIEWLWQTYWIFEQNSIISAYGNNIIKELIEEEINTGKEFNHDSVTLQYIAESNLTHTAFLELQKLNKEMLYNRKLITFNMLTQTQKEIMNSDNPEEVLSNYLLKTISLY